MKKIKYLLFAVITLCICTTNVFADTYKIMYDANGGTGAPQTTYFDSGSCATIPSGKPSMEKNNFVGWSKNEDATEADPDLAPGKTYCTEENTILYAVWQVQTGVEDYLLALILVLGLSAAALFVSQKKAVFRQI